MLLKQKFSSAITLSFVILFAFIVYVYEHYGSLSILLRKKVKDQNALILAALNTSHIPMSIKDKDLRIVAVNKAFCDILDVDPTTLVGKSLDDFKKLTKNNKIINRIELHKSKDELLLQDENTRFIEYQDNNLSFIKECVFLNGQIIGIVTQIIDKSDENNLEKVLAESTQGIAAIRRLVEILK